MSGLAVGWVERAKLSWARFEARGQQNGAGLLNPQKFECDFAAATPPLDGWWCAVAESVGQRA